MQKIFRNPYLSIGLFRFAILVLLIGLVVMAYANNWKLIVREDELEIHRLLHKTQTVRISELTVPYGKKNEMIISKEGKRLLQLIDLLIIMRS